jgi:ssDNA-binding Zn-finger/Zn-ribbon topoisomerase 1
MITKPEPYCPICGAKMILRRPKPGPNMPNWSPFWGCGRYPDCHGKRNIDPETGEPEEDYEIYAERNERHLGSPHEYGDN